MHKSGRKRLESPEEQAWDEPEAVLLLQNAGALVAGLEATGARMPQRERYHARLVAAHDARDMALTKSHSTGMWRPPAKPTGRRSRRIRGIVDRMPLALTSAERKGFDVSLFGVASSMGVVQSELEKLLAGQAGVGVAKKLG
jgi:hypothetical protein